MTNLKIEAGKCYETRDGRKAYVLGERGDTDGKPGNPMPFIGYVENGNSCSWGRDGSTWLGAAWLISEWKEPRKGEVWVTVRACVLDGVDVTTATTGPPFFSNDALAVLGPIPWTEGQGLDGEGSE